MTNSACTKSFLLGRRFTLSNTWLTLLVLTAMVMGSGTVAEAQPCAGCAAYSGLPPAQAQKSARRSPVVVTLATATKQAEAATTLHDSCVEASADNEVTESAIEAEAIPAGWVSLFNGKDLTGWTPKIRGYKAGDNFGNTFRVEDGYLTVRYDQYEKFDQRFGHLFYKTSYSHYLMRVEYRFVGEQCPGGPGWAIRNSGVMVHGQSPESMAVDQDFPVSIEVQLLGGTGNGKRTTANLCTPGTHVEMQGKLVKRHCTSSTSKTYHGEQWVTVDIEVRGNTVIRHLIDGEEVLAYQKPQLDPGDRSAKPLIQDGNVQLDGGTISLQSESHPVQFRKVWLKGLPVKGVAPK